MTRFGYKLMSEEHPPRALVENARHAEESGFDFVDHLVLIGVGPDQQGFLRFWRDQLAPRLRAA